MYKEITIAQLCRILKSKTRINSQELVRGVSVDSRTIKPGELFFALKGNKTDGHLFSKEALKNGARAVVASRKIDDDNVILVEDALYALGELARYRRSFISSFIIGITGTNGKTTVKNIIYEILKYKFSTFCSEKSYNSLLGLPLSILKINEERHAILEMGTSGPGEIKRLCEIAKPEIGIITLIGPGHIEGFGSIQGVKREKLELIESLPENSFCVVGDGIEQKDIRKRIDVIKISISDAEKVELKEDGSSFFYQGTNFFIPLLGMNNIYNALIALAVTKRLGVEPFIQKDALLRLKPAKGRMEPIRINDLLIINDTYNANPLSMRSAIDFSSLIERRKIFVFGDMLELGTDSERYHNEIGEYAKKKSDILLTYGEKAELYKGRHFKDAQELVINLLDEITGGELILFKASRALEFERLVNQFIKRL